MSALELYIGKSKYVIDCQESEKEKIIKLANKLNERVNDLSFKMRGGDEKTILMLSAMTIEEELDSLKNITNQNKNQEHKQTNNKSCNDLESASFFIESLANKIKKY